jgi:hypothetical protein
MKRSIKKTIIPIIVMLFIISSSQFVSAWGPNGHRIIAEIAEQHLTPKALKAIKEILDSRPMAKCCIWADFIYSEKPWKFSKKWHYINVKESEDNKKEMMLVLEKSHEDPEINNVIEAIDYFTDILMGDKNKIKEFKERVEKEGATLYNHNLEATALSFLTHFVGDVHQPMHVGLPSDRGGNNVKLLWFNKNSNLHRLWDTELIESEFLSFSDYVRFINFSTKQKVQSYQESEVVDWALESIEVCRQVYKELDLDPSEKYKIPTLGYQFSHDYIETLNDRLLRAGIRLAGLLNKIFQ